MLQGARRAAPAPGERACRATGDRSRSTPSQWSGAEEFPAVVEPPLTDTPEPGPPPGPAAPVAWERTGHPSSADLSARVAPDLSADGRVRAALDGRRYVVLGASGLCDDKDRAVPAILVHGCTGRRTLEITPADAEPPVVVGVTESRAQPGPSPAGIERAVELAVRPCKDPLDYDNSHPTRRCPRTACAPTPRAAGRRAR